MRTALIYQHATSERDKEIADSRDKRIAKQQGTEAPKPRHRKRGNDGESKANAS